MGIWVRPGLRDTRVNGLGNHWDGAPEHLVHLCPKEGLSMASTDSIRATYFCACKRSALNISSAMMARRSSNPSADAPNAERLCTQESGQSGHCVGVCVHSLSARDVIYIKSTRSAACCCRNNEEAHRHKQFSKNDFVKPCCHRASGHVHKEIA